MNKKMIQINQSIMVGIIIAGLCHVLHHGMIVNHDISWLVLAAKRLLTGGNYIDDFYEISTPFSILLYAPIAWFDESPETIQIYFDMLFGGIAAWITLQLSTIYRHLSNIIPYYVTSTFMLWMMASGYDLGQKDQIAFLLTIPYLILLACEHDQRKIPAWNICISAFVMAIGVLAKNPISILLPTLWILQKKPTSKIIWYGAIFISLGIIITFWNYPEWIKLFIENIKIYKDYDESWIFVILKLFVPTIWFVAVFIIWQNRNGWYKLLLLTLIGIWFSIVLQKKGWDYHLLPLKMIGSICIIGLIHQIFYQRSWTKRITGVIFAFVGMILLIFPGTSQAFNAKIHFSTFREEPIYQFLHTQKKQQHWILLSTSVSAFPMQSYISMQWGSRFPALWTLPWIVNRERKTTLTNAEIENVKQKKEEFFAMLKQDIQRWKPTLILIPKTGHHQGILTEFNIKSYLLSNASFEEEWKNYEEISESFKDVEVFQRKKEKQ